LRVGEKQVYEEKASRGARGAKAVGRKLVEGSCSRDEKIMKGNKEKEKTREKKIAFHVQKRRQLGGGKKKFPAPYIEKGTFLLVRRKFGLRGCVPNSKT